MVHLHLAGLAGDNAADYGTDDHAGNCGIAVTSVGGGLGDQREAGHQAGDKRNR
jgi:hypothetical protein